MRADPRTCALVFASAVVVAATSCYSPPVIPPDKPLSCVSAAAADSPDRKCPGGYTCRADSCVPSSCAKASDCPAGFTCTFTATGGGGLTCLPAADAAADGPPDAPAEATDDGPGAEGGAGG